MKRRISLFLAVIMVVAMLIPVQGFAAESNGLEDAIKAAKSVFTIPDSYSRFNYNVWTRDAGNIWSLNWSSKDSNGGGISVQVDDKGRITYYYSYVPYVKSDSKLPKVSKQEAIAKAEEFFNKLDPGLQKQLKLIDNGQVSLYDNYYSLNFTRLVNGIPFPSNSVSISIDCQTGEVRNYNCSWTDDLTFPDASNVITMDDAQKAYKDKLGIRLIYNYKYTDDKIGIYTAYSPKYSSSYVIDAVSGEKVNVQSGRYEPYYNYDMAEKAAMSGGAIRNEVQLSPEEQKAVEEVEKLLSKEAAEKIARDFKTLELTDSYKLNNASLYRDWADKDEFTWNLSFSKQSDENSKVSGYASYVSVSINAVTGEIRSFNVNLPSDPDAQPKFDEAASKAAVEAFLKEVKPDKFSQTEYDDTYDNSIIIYMGKGSASQYNFRYIRKVNGTAFPSNNISVGFDAVNGKVISMNSTWFNTEFPAVDKVLPIDGIYTKLFDSVGMELQYRLAYPENNQYGADVKPEVKLVYALKTDKPANFDANTGEILNNNGEPYKEIKPVEYSDIKGHYAENAISMLAQYGISLAGNEFKPDGTITQKDFFRLVLKGLGVYSTYSDTDSDRGVEAMYNYLIGEGILKESEKAPDASLTRQEGAKLFVRALKYDKVAEIKGIFNCQFKDAADINPDLLGYVSIASGLGIINGTDGQFNPYGDLSRADTAIMIYNYLTK